MASRDPFSSLPDVAAYLPRDATERALGLLAEAIHLADRPVVLEGPPGIGKTLLLHVLAGRLGGQVRPVSVPIPTLAPSELWHWVASSLGLAAEAGGEALDAIEQSQRSSTPVLLLIDDANSLPEETLLSLRAGLDAQMPGLRAVLVVSDGQEENESFYLSLGEPVHRVRFAEPMTAEESSEYICARLAASDVDAAARERFDDAMLARLHTHTHGVPAVVHELADLLLRPDAAARAHELAPELRPEIVSMAAALRSSDLIDRVGEWGDEDLARTVAGRSGTSAADEAVDTDVVGLFAPEDDAEDALDSVRAEEAVAAPAAEAIPVEVASPETQPEAPADEVAAPVAAVEAVLAVEPVPASAPAAPGSLRKEKATASPEPERASVRGRIALAAGVVGLLAGLTVWQLDLFAPPKPSHVATSMRNQAAPILADVAAPVAPKGAAIAPVADEELASNDEAPEEEASVAALAPPIVEQVAERAAREAAAPVAVVPVAEPEPVTAEPSEPSEPSEPAEPPRASTNKPTTAAATEPKAAAVAVTAAPAKRRVPSKPHVAAVAGQKPPSDIAVAPSAAVTHLASILAPAGTRIEIGDDVRGTAPLAAVLLPEGEHRVRWTLEDGASGEQIFRVDAANRILDLSASTASKAPAVSSE